MWFLVTLVLAASVFTGELFAWGKQGHAAVAEIASSHLNEKTKLALSKLTQGDSLTDLANWPDQIRSNKKYRPYGPWHYTTVPDFQEYKKPKSSREGSIVEQIKNSLAVLKGNGELGIFTKKQHLAWLIHLVGDIHQPLHVGRPGDKGGNSIRVLWFGKSSNLHSIWDSKIIDKSRLSYAVLARDLMKEARKKSINVGGSVEDWANESVSLRAYPYDLMLKGEKPKDAPQKLKPLSDYKSYMKRRGFKPPKKDLPNLSENYYDRNFVIVRERIYQAGIRLANLLNEVYGDKK